MPRGGHGVSSEERGFLAAAHNESNSMEARMHAAKEYVRLHKDRTGEDLDPQTVLEEKSHRATGGGGAHERSGGGGGQETGGGAGGGEGREGRERGGPAMEVTGAEGGGGGSARGSVKQAADMGTHERSYLAAAHNESNSEQARMHAAQEYCKLHADRTGEELDPHDVMSRRSRHGAGGGEHATRSHEERMK